jgi:hypothetical protein
MQTVAQSFVVLDPTHSGIQLGLTTAPSSPGGAERARPRQLMTTFDIAAREPASVGQ